mgnify:CR=1 FL=1
MKPWHFSIFKELIQEINPSTIGEIGCHNGRTAIQLCYCALETHNNNVHYTGYDAFDDIGKEESKYQEFNGKGIGRESEARRWLSKVKKRFHNRFDFNLIKGYTNQTIVTPVCFDFVYIDAGHSYESVLHDWNMVNESKLIVFDDHHLDGVNRVLKEVVEASHNVEYIPSTENSRASAIVRNF